MFKCFCAALVLIGLVSVADACPKAACAGNAAAATASAANAAAVANANLAAANLMAANNACVSVGNACSSGRSRTGTKTSCGVGGRVGAAREARKERVADRRDARRNKAVSVSTTRTVVRSRGNAVSMVPNAAFSGGTFYPSDHGAGVPAGANFGEVPPAPNSTSHTTATAVGPNASAKSEANTNPNGGAPAGQPEPVFSRPGPSGN